MSKVNVRKLDKYIFRVRRRDHTEANLDTLTGKKLEFRLHLNFMRQIKLLPDMHLFM